MLVFFFLFFAPSPKMTFEVLALMMEADLDHNGTIEFPEFLQLMKEKYGRDDQEADLRLMLLGMCL